MSGGGVLSGATGLNGVNIGHRYPILLVDRVLECAPGERVRAVKNVSLNEKVMLGHFPGQPIFPGIYIIEALCQCAQIMLGAKTAVTAKLESFKFTKPVLPGDQLLLEVSLVEMIGGFQCARAQASVSGKVVAKGQIVGREI